MLKRTHLTLSLLVMAGAGCGADDAPPPDTDAIASTLERAPDNTGYEPTAGEDLSAPENDLADATGGPTGAKGLHDAPSCAAADLKLTRFPLDGTNGQHYVINNYLDLDAALTTIKDYLGKTGSLARTYDGHRGLDIDISSFREMDAGTAVVYAAAPGVVEQIIQNQYDRNTSCTGSWNVVKVRHTNGWAIFYGHIKKGSAKVVVGQSVVAGTPLAVAGSAGCSTQPHLHLEVQDCSNVARETLQLAGMWTSPPVYDPASGVMDVMLRAGAAPTVQQIKDPAPNPAVITPGASLGVGLSLAVRGGDGLAIVLTDPNGNASTTTWTVPGVARFSHWYPAWTLTVGQTVGKWTVGVKVNGALKATRTIGVSHVAPGFAEVARHGIPAASYQTTFDDITAAGYRPVWVDGYEVSGSTYFNAVFGPATVAWAARHGLTAAQYQAEFDLRTGQGYRLTQVDSYLDGGQIRYACIFDRSAGTAWVAYHGVSQAAHQSQFNTLTAQGYRPVNIAVVNAGGGRSFTALYDKAPVGAFSAESTLAISDYQGRFDANVAAGRRPAYLDAFLDGATRRISAIWDSTPGAWVARHGLTAAQYQTEFDTWTGQGYRTRCVTGYDGGGSARFAAIWTK